MVRWIFKLTILKQAFLRITLVVMSVIIFLFFFLVISFTLLLFQENDNQPIASTYFVLNAAIKNTCYLDPQRNHCPTNLQELINIEPENFSQLLKGKGVIYQYYPQTNEYTLIIRHDNRRGVIFDPRMTNLKNYGYQDDFFDVDIKGCCGNYQITNPPPIPGPWDHIN